MREHVHVNFGAIPKNPNMRTNFTFYGNEMYQSDISNWNPKREATKENKKQEKNFCENKFMSFFVLENSRGWKLRIQMKMSLWEVWWSWTCLFKCFWWFSAWWKIKNLCRKFTPGVENFQHKFKLQLPYPCFFYKIIREVIKN